MHESWLNASNILALLLVGLIAIECAAVLAAGAWQISAQTPMSLEGCISLSALWPDRYIIADLLTNADEISRAALCTIGLLPRIFCALAVPLGLIWMATYWVIRVSQKGSPFVLGDDFIRLFFIAFCAAKFATQPYSALISGRANLWMLISCYLLTSFLQVVIIFLFQRRLNELVFISSRD